MLVNREVILAKIEATYNTDAAPNAAADAVLVEEPSWANEGLRMIERPAVRQNIGMLQQVYAGRLETVTFSCELKGSGTAGTAPEIDALLRMCGYGVTTVANTSNTYAPVSTGHESGTIHYYQDGTRHILTGCRGNVSFNLETGNKGMAEFTVTGHAAAVTDVALPTPTYDSTVPPPVLAAAFSVDGFSAVINALSFDTSNTIAMPPDISAADGFGEIQITQRDINGTFDPEHELVATEDFLGNFTSGKSMALATGTIGSVAGNRYAISMPAIYYRDVSPGDRDGVRTLELPFGAVESSGDDEVSIAFT